MFAILDIQHGGMLMNELDILREIQNEFEGVLINAEIELNLDNTKVVERIIRYKKLRDQLDDLVLDMTDRYRNECNDYIDERQTVA